MHSLQKKTCLFNFYCCFESKLHWIVYINYKHIVSLFFSFVSQRFCTCIRSYLQTKLSVFQVLFPHIFIYTTCCSNCYVVIVVSMLFSFFDSNKKMKQKRMQKTKLEIGVFSFVAFGALCFYYSKMVELVSWMSFLFTWMGLLKRRFLLLAIWSSWVLNRFLLTWIHFQ